MEFSSICPRFEKAIDIISKKWTVLLIHQLLSGLSRFSDLEHSMPISGKLLSERLKELEKEGIVVRHVYAETPVRIEYSLTQKGRELEPIIKYVQNWSSTWIASTTEN